MITQDKYEIYLKNAAERKFLNININWGSWYTQYLYYESMWETYFLDFIAEYSKLKKKPNIKFVFWESCPGGMPFPHQNYAFDSSRYNNPIDGIYDKYLARVCKKFSVTWQGGKQEENIRIGDVIKALGTKGVIIIDLYPTHGISLEKENRLKLFDKVFKSYSMEKLTRIGNLTSKFSKSSTIKVTSELNNNGFKGITPETKEDIKTALKLSSLPTFQKY